MLKILNLNIFWSHEWLLLFTERFKVMQTGRNNINATCEMNGVKSKAVIEERYPLMVNIWTFRRNRKVIIFVNTPSMHKRNKQTTYLEIGASYVSQTDQQFEGTPQW